MTDAPASTPAGGEPDTQALLEDWSGRLTTGLGLTGLEVDIDAILGLAGVAAHAVVRPAAPLTTFLVGYAAGLAAADPSLSAADAFRRANDIALALARSAQ